MSFAVALQNFCRETTAHSLRMIGDPKRKWWVRLIWTCILISCSSAFGYQARLLLRRYLSYETNSKIRFITAEALPFPAVSICNMNPFQNDKIPEGSLLWTYVNSVANRSAENRTKEIERLCADNSSDYWHVWRELFCGPNGATSFDWTNCENGTSSCPNGDAHLTEHPEDSGALAGIFLEYEAGKRVNFLAAVHRPEQYERALQNKDDFIRDCHVGGEDHCERYFDDWTHWEYGRCYRFNCNGSYLGSQAGRSGALHLLLNVNAEKYVLEMNRFGCRVVVHGPNQQPFPSIEGFYAPVGAVTSVGVTAFTARRLSEPYGQCQEAGSPTVNGYDYDGNYTVNGCTLTCMRRRIVDQCGCWHFEFSTHQQLFHTDVSLLNGTEICWRPQQLHCAKVQQLDPLNYKRCPCAPPCHELNYDLTISQASWPNPYNFDGRICPSNDTMAHAECVADPASFFSKNYLVLEIYFQTLSYYEYSEKPSYDFLALVSEFGGQLGLWIGASVCTIGEVLSLLVNLTAELLKRIRACIKNASVNRSNMVISTTV